MNPSISLQNISKTFPSFASPRARLRAIIYGQAAAGPQDFTALRNLDLEVSPGTTLGVLGQNGSGKSTLLQIIAGIMRPSTGKVITRGRVSTILELGAGFNPDFTGRENVYLSGHILGMNPTEVAGRMTEIEEFAEIGNFIDRPTRTYSSGMYVRLAFAVAVSLDPEILLIDEILAVGDTYFQHKCVHRIRQLQEKGKTIIFVTHDIEGMRNICDQAVILDYSRLIAWGEAGEIASRYMALIDQREREPEPDQPPANSEYARYGGREAEITKIKISDAQGKETALFQAGQEMVLRFQVLFHQGVDNFVLGNILRNRYGVDVYGMNNHWLGQKLHNFKAGEQVEVIFRQPVSLAAGTYSINPAASTHLGEDNYKILDWINHAAIITVENSRRLAGYVEIPCQITIEKLSNRQ